MWRLSCVSLRPMRVQFPIFTRLAATSAFVVAISLSTPTFAQSFLETLFGAPKQAMPLPNGYRTLNRLLPPGGMHPSGLNGAHRYTIRQMPQPRRDGDDDDGAAARAKDRSHGYRTVCVRMCDGFYWPVSFSTPRSRLYRDATVCSSSCGAEAKLFHFASSGGQIDDAVDLTGRAYSRLPNAFRYRKSLVQGCTCRPEPWSEAEIDRHHVYALNNGTVKSEANPPARRVEYPVPTPSGAQQNAMVSDAKEDASTAVVAFETNPAVATATQRISTERQTSTPSAGDIKPATPAKARKAVAVIQSPRVKPTAYPTASAPSSSSGFWGGGPAPKYNWPGDAPVRVR